MKITRRQTTTCLLAFLVVVAGTVAGFSTSIPQPPNHSPRLPPAGHSLSELWIIASRNLQIGLQLLLGSVSLGIYSLFQCFGIGFAFGLVVGVGFKSGVPLAKMALLLGPHTFVEFAGFVLLGAIEFEAAVIAYRKLRYDQLPEEKMWLTGWAKQILLGFALIVIAAVIEVYVTGFFAQRFN